MEATFDVNSFLQTETTATFDENFTPIPPNEYRAVIREVKPDVRGEQPCLLVTWEIDDQSVRELLGRDDPQITQTVWLDVGPNGQLETGRNKNVGLGQLRAAVNQNNGQPWAPGMLLGQVAKILIKQTPDKTDPSKVHSNVKGVARVA